MSVLLTGATGFLGRHVLWDLLRQDPDVEVRCLLRPNRRASPERRLEQLLGPAGGRLPAGARRRAHAVTGDITHEQLVTDAREREVLVGEVDRVVHCAATVRFDMPLAEARRINVDGTANVLRFAEDAAAQGGLGRLDHFSTAYVAGRAAGPQLEAHLPSTTFHNTYEQTKWESEALVREHQGHLPISIYRPSIVVGDSRTGYTPNFRVLYWPLKVLSTGLVFVVPLDPRGIVDVVPVDYVVEAFRTLSASEHSIGSCYHLAAGPHGQSTCGELLDAAIDRFGVRRPVLISPRLSYRIVRPLLYAVIWGRRRPLLRQGEQYFPYFAHRASFDTAASDAALAAHDVTHPRVDEYFHTILQYCIDTRWGAERPGAPPPEAD